ncbi:MAG: HupE/UreJ family protein [Devosia sp.]
MRVILSLLLIAIPTAALAHTGHGDTAGFVHGFVHPLSGLDHVLPMLAVGLLAFVLGGRALWLVPLSFVGMMAIGFLLGRAGLELPMVELGIAFSGIVIGGIAALGRPIPLAAAMGLVGAFALFHGQAHGSEMPADANGLNYAFGFIAATALLHLSGIAAALTAAALAGRFGRRLVQIAGGALALGGLGFLAGWL